MRRAIQFISVAILSLLIVVGCDSMTGSESDIKNDSPVLSKTYDSAANVNSTVVVSGDTFDSVEYSGWLFNRDTSTQTPYIFTFDKASIGNGSLYVEPITNTINGNNDKFIGELFFNEEITNFESVSYDFLIGSGGTVADANHFYLNVYANFGETPFPNYYDCKYDVVPSAGSTSDWTTVSFDPTQEITNPSHITTRSSSPYTCPSTPADMDLQSPGSTIHFVSINVGDTSGNDDDLDGYYDNVVVTYADGTTVYDFEPANPVTKDHCKNGSWENFGFKNQGQCVRFVNTGKDSR